MKKLVSKIDPLWLGPITLLASIGYDVVQIFHGAISNSLGQDGTKYLGTAIGADVTALIYFATYRMGMQQQKDIRKQRDDFAIEATEAHTQQLESKLENHLLKQKIARLERKLNLPLSEDVEIETPTASLEDVLNSTLTTK